MTGSTLGPAEEQWTEILEQLREMREETEQL